MATVLRDGKVDSGSQGIEYVSNGWAGLARVVAVWATQISGQALLSAAAGFEPRTLDATTRLVTRHPASTTGARGVCLARAARCRCKRPEDLRSHGPASFRDAPRSCIFLMKRCH